jgi:prepilin peptidase dependent protein C
MVEVLLAMMLVVVVTTLSGYHRALAARFTVFNQYRQLWHHAWNQSQLSTNVLPAGWQASRGRQRSQDVSASRLHLFLLWVGAVS